MLSYYRGKELLGARSVCALSTTDYSNVTGLWGRVDVQVRGIVAEASKPMYGV